MSYIGYTPKPGTYIKFDDISSSFDGVTTEFDVTQDAVAVTIPSLRQCIVSLNGVLQEPGVAIQAGSTSTKLQFSEAPQSGDTFWGMVFGTAYSISTVADGAITAVKLDDGAVSTIKIQNGAITNAKIPDDEITGAKLVDDTITSDKYADSSITLQKIQDSAVTFPKIATSAVASQVQAEAGTATDVLMTPERTKQFSDANTLIPKAICKFTGATGAIVYEAGNVNTVVRDDAGDWTVTFDNDMSDADYVINVSIEQSNSVSNVFSVYVLQGSQTASGFSIHVDRGDGTDSDPTSLYFTVYGDLA